MKKRSERKKQSNIDFEKHPILSKYVLPALIALLLGRVVTGIIAGTWLETGILIFGTTYLILCFTMSIMVKASKKFLIFLYVYTLFFTLAVAYHLWTQNWVGGILEAIMICVMLSEMQHRYNNNGLKVEEGK
ncbi:hypothetical protein MCCARTNEY_160 [Bacillus phage vB_BanH_McCartney]|nr:hypothetical protein MCCARTNEY_160 [Bacillus phage vB_BanH_McCartney]